MFGMPQGMSPDLFDPSIFLLSGYLFGMLGMLILIALGVGLVTLPIFFLVLYAIEQAAWFVADTSGSFIGKLVLIMFRGLRRSPLRTSLTYLALFVLTTVLVFLYTILTFIGKVTTEKEANFKAIVTHKTTIPSQMKPGHYTRFKEIVLQRTAAGDAADARRRRHHELVVRRRQHRPHQQTPGQRPLHVLHGTAEDHDHDGRPRRPQR